LRPFVVVGVRVFEVSIIMREKSSRDFFSKARPIMREKDHRQPLLGERQDLLTPREKEVIAWIAHGKSNWETSMILGIAERTVKFHMKNIIHKLDAMNRSHAVAKALTEGMFDLNVADMGERIISFRKDTLVSSATEIELKDSQQEALAAVQEKIERLSHSWLNMRDQRNAAGILGGSYGGTMRGNAILFVDDELVILTALKIVFSREGFQVLTATSGEEALNILEHEHVDVVVSDERMPGISGIELLSVVKDKYPEKIRVLLTAYAEMNTMLSAINKVEAHRMIIKPYRNDEIVQTVRELVARQEGRVANERTLEAAEREADFAYRVARIMCHSQFSLEQNSWIMNLLRDYIRADSLSLMLLDPQHDELVVQAATNKNIIGMKRRLDDNAISSCVAREGRSIRYNPDDPPEKLSDFCFHDQKVSRYQNEAFLSVPVKDENRLVGVFNVADPQDGRISCSTETTVTRLIRWVGAMVQPITVKSITGLPSVHRGQ